MTMKLTILGCNSATPKINHRPTAQLLEMKGHLFLIDCGEATQTAIRMVGAKFSRIKHIFISHLHGDHFYGIFGLISTFQLMGREAELHIYAPKGAKEAILLLLKLSGAWTPFPLIFHPLEEKQSVVVFEDEKVRVKTIPLDHRVYANGYLFEEKQNQRKLNIERLREKKIDVAYWEKIKNGGDAVLETGEIIKNKEITFEGEKRKKYAFCSDTAYKKDIVEIIEKVDILYHEATFLKENEDLAEKTKHSTAQQAGKIAKEAEVENLIIGHFSSRYSDKSLLREEAKKEFENVFLARDGAVFTLKNGILVES